MNKSNQIASCMWLSNKKTKVANENKVEKEYLRAS